MRSSKDQQSEKLKWSVKIRAWSTVGQPNRRTTLLTIGTQLTACNQPVRLSHNTPSPGTMWDAGRATDGCALHDITTLRYRANFAFRRLRGSTNHWGQQCGDGGQQCLSSNNGQSCIVYTAGLLKFLIPRRFNTVVLVLGFGLVNYIYVNKTLLFQIISWYTT